MLGTLIYLVLFALSTTYSSDTQSNQLEFRIVGGTPVIYRHEFPYQASIHRSKQHSCAGTIISSKNILTAAHCVSGRDKNSFTIFVGLKYLNESKKMTGFKVVDYMVHPRFEKKTLRYDIALITLDKALVFNKTVRYIGLRSKPIVPGEKLIASGWGRTSRDSKTSNILRWVEVTAMNSSDCKHKMRRSSFYVSRHKNICTTPMIGAGTCNGDSGGPLIDANDELVGVVSWGKPCADGWPDIYTSVPYHYNWIMEQL